MNNSRFIFLSSVITFCLLLMFANIATPIVQKTNYNLPVHKTLYLSKDIDPDETFHIMMAANEWEEVTSHQVTFEVKPLLDPSLISSNSIMIINIGSDYPQVLSLDRVKGYHTLGFYRTEDNISYIALVYERINEKDLTQIMLHELGHALGLKHIEGLDGINTLMYPTIDEASAHITQSDYSEFCELYKCDSDKFNILQ